MDHSFSFRRASWFRRQWSTGEQIENQARGSLVSRPSSVSSVFAQSCDHFSPDEIKFNAAVSANRTPAPLTSWTWDCSAVQNCGAQSPALFICTPVGWLSALRAGARKRYVLQALLIRIISEGCANGSDAGPVCDSIPRVALLSDTKGRVALEAMASHPVTQVWQNGFVARAQRITSRQGLFPAVPNGNRIDRAMV